MSATKLQIVSNDSAAKILDDLAHATQERNKDINKWEQQPIPIQEVVNFVERDILLIVSCLNRALLCLADIESKMPTDKKDE
jgi:hypothetical protein